MSHGHSRALKAGDVLELKGTPPVLVRYVAGSRQVVEPPPKESAGANPACAAMVPAKPDTTDNAASLAFKLTYGNFSFFDGGDLTRDIEQKLVCPVNLVGSVVLYQTDAHGMDVSNDASLLKSLHPKVVVINNGPKKGAEPETMETLFSTPGVEAIWQVHKNLNAGARNTESEFIANDELDCSARFIKAVVDPQEGFTLQTGKAGKPHRYAYH